MSRIFCAVLAVAALSCANYRTGIAIAPSETAPGLTADGRSRFLNAVKHVATAHELKIVQLAPSFYEAGILAKFEGRSIDLYAYESAERQQWGVNIIQNGAWSQSEQARQLERDLAKSLRAEFPQAALSSGQNRDLFPYAP